MNHIDSNLVFRPQLRVAFFALLVFSCFNFATYSGSEVYLQGTFIEVGVDENGYYGGNNAAPAGFHPGNNRRTNIGFVADYGRDGWNVGSPVASGDYFLPGTHEEGFVLQWTTGSEKTYTNAGGNPKNEIGNTTALTETSSGSTKSVVWSGAVGSGGERVSVTHTTSFDVSNSYFVVNTVLTNIGSVTLNSFEFMRTVDGDNDQDYSGSYTTRNYIAYKPNATSDKALVVATGNTYTSMVLGLGTIDSRAVGSPINTGIISRDPDVILDSPLTQYTAASPYVNDRAISLAYRFGTLSPGQAVSINYAYILNVNDLDAALGNLDAVRILQPTGTVSGNSVIFQATTNNVPNTQSVEFFINGASIGTDSTPDFGGNFQVTFDSTNYNAGVLNLKAVATFSSGEISSIDRLVTVIVNNAGPPISFTSPISGATFSGTGIAAAISVNDVGHPPTRVSFYREVNGVSTFLAEDSSAPFATTFNVNDLSNGDTVIIKAVAFDAAGEMTTASVSGRVNIGNSFYNVPSGWAVADKDTDTTLASGSDIFVARKQVSLKYSGTKVADIWFGFDAGDVDLASLDLTRTDTASEKKAVIDWSGVAAGDHLEHPDHALYVDATWSNGAYVCPSASTTTEVSSSCTGKVSFTHGQCQSGTTTSGITCTIVSGQYKLAGLSGTGIAANGNTQMTINDSAEGSNVATNTAATFYTYYHTNPGDAHIAGATCQIEFDDNPGVWNAMTEDAGNGRYTYTKAAGFATAATHTWQVDCVKATYTQLTTSDTIQVGTAQTGSIPFFEDLTLLLALIFASLGAAKFTKNNEEN